MAIAKQFVQEHGKPKGTHISRIPEGTEDSLFKSFFEEFYKPVVYEAKTPMQTSADQDITKMMEKDKKAANLTMSKLGGSFTYKLYRLSAGLDDVEEVTGEF